MTRQSPTTDFIPLQAALAHVAARELAPKLALVRALATKVRARGFVRYHWPPYLEGEELLSPELFSDYGPPHGPARIDWAEGTAVMADGHPAPACTVYGIEVSKADLLACWPGRLAVARRLNIRRLVKQAEQASGRPVAAITLPDGTKFTFGEEAGNALDAWMAKHAH
jgi:hypothetical protein